LFGYCPSGRKQLLFNDLAREETLGRDGDLKDCVPAWNRRECPRSAETAQAALSAELIPYETQKTEKQQKKENCK
jgi:hypothetical protein